ncbi:hypothetical protein AB5I41_12520 [Sphingomonas sp. MMS24-JH45]
MLTSSAAATMPRLAAPHAASLRAAGVGTAGSLAWAMRSGWRGEIV